MKFQIPEETMRRRGQYFPYLLENFDCIIVKNESEIDPDRTVVWGAPFDTTNLNPFKIFCLVK